MYDYEKERLEAVSAGQRALDSLNLAKNELNSAKNWGIVDLIGGGFLSTLCKRSKMDQAQSYMDDAKSDLKRFQKELSDITDESNLNVQTGDFFTFADYFFDGLAADWLVQDRINQAREQVDEAISRVEGILAQLHT